MSLSSLKSSGMQVGIGLRSSQYQIQTSKLQIPIKSTNAVAIKASGIAWTNAQLPPRALAMGRHTFTSDTSEAKSHDNTKRAANENKKILILLMVCEGG